METEFKSNFTITHTEDLANLWNKSYNPNFMQKDPPPPQVNLGKIRHFPPQFKWKSQALLFQQTCKLSPDKSIGK